MYSLGPTSSMSCVSGVTSAKRTDAKTLHTVLRLCFDSGMPVKNRIGERYGRLVVIERAGSNKQNKALWLCRCDCGGSTITWFRPTQLTQSCGCITRENIAALGRASRKGDVIKYRSAHISVRLARGSAKTHMCVDCQGPADEWSLRKDAPVTHIGPNDRGRLLRYSVDVNDYDPRCKQCHMQYDASES